MYSYIIGKVTDIEGNTITLLCGNIGYMVYTPNPFIYQLDDIDYKVYLYHHIREDEECLYGFRSKEEKDLFLKLISVKGLGPKMALPILSTGSIAGIVDAINRGNVLYLKKFPKIGDKVANQMILDLKGKLGSISDNEVSNTDSDLYDALIGLGYKAKDISSVIYRIDKNNSIEDQIKEALKMFLK